MAFVKGHNNETLWISKEDKQKADDEAKIPLVNWHLYVTDRGPKLTETDSSLNRSNEII